VRFYKYFAGTRRTQEETTPVNNNERKHLER
jgi:hypothetical protein